MPFYGWSPRQRRTAQVHCTDAQRHHGSPRGFGLPQPQMANALQEPGSCRALAVLVWVTVSGRIQVMAGSSGLRGAPVAVAWDPAGLEAPSGHPGAKGSAAHPGGMGLAVRREPAAAQEVQAGREYSDRPASEHLIRLNDSWEPSLPSFISIRPFNDGSPVRCNGIQASQSWDSNRPGRKLPSPPTRAGARSVSR